MNNEGVRKYTWILSLALLGMAAPSHGQIAPIKTCNGPGIGSTRLVADAPVTITSVSVEHGDTSSTATFCLVKVRIPRAINLWVGLPMEGKWNGRLQSEGGGGYGGLISAPLHSVSRGYVGVQTDTGHPEPSDITRAGDFALRSPGTPDPALKVDFAFRAVHLMAVIGKQLAHAFYGRAPTHSYWNGCSTGGRQGLRMAQDFPDDYDGILAGAPAIHWDRFQAYQIWPQVVMKELTGGVISSTKQRLVTNAAIAACDTIDDVADGLINDPNECSYSAIADKAITKASCSSTDDSCLTPREADAIDRIWAGATNTDGDLLWPGLEKGAPLGDLAGPTPFFIATNQPRFWVFLDPAWDWRSLTLSNYEAYFAKTVEQVGPLMSSDNPDLSAFDASGGKIVTWHGYNDPVIMPEGSIRYYNSVVQHSGGRHRAAQEFFRLFMAPGVEHCGYPKEKPAPIPGRLPAVGWSLAAQENLFNALVDWVELGRAPERVIARWPLPEGRERTRPLCPYPSEAVYKGGGDTDEAASFACSDVNKPISLSRSD